MYVPVKQKWRAVPAIVAVAMLGAVAGCGGDGAGAGGEGFVGTTATQVGSTAATPKVQVVRIGTGNEIEKVDVTKNAVPYTAAVGDADGNPVSGVQVTATLRSLRYYKGFFQWNGDFWQQFVTAECQNEDVNGNLTLDPGEDTNGDGLLTPANSAVATPATAFSADSGFVDMKVTYPRDQSTWLEVRLTVTAAIGVGTEAQTTRDFVLPGVAADYTSDTQAPPGVRSPYGFSNNCADPY